jgi:hypothetical protein
VAGYNLYYGTSEGNYSEVIDVGAVSTVVVPALDPDVTYYFVVTAYDADRLESAPSNEATFTVPPEIDVQGLTDGSTLNSGTSVILSATASSGFGAIAKVEFYLGTQKIGESSDPSHSMAWSAPAGDYQITAVASDANGAQLSSSQISVSVVPFAVSGMRMLPDGTPELTITGAANHLNHIYCSTDLLKWTLVSDLMNTDGTLVVNDQGAKGVPRIFYKVMAD